MRVNIILPQVVDLTPQTEPKILYECKPNSSRYCMVTSVFYQSRRIFEEGEHFAAADSVCLATGKLMDLHLDASSYFAASGGPKLSLSAAL